MTSTVIVAVTPLGSDSSLDCRPPDPEQMGPTVTVRGTDASHWPAGQLASELALAGLAGKPNIPDHRGTWMAQQVIDVPVSGVSLAVSNLTVPIEPPKASGTEGAANIAMQARCQ